MGSMVNQVGRELEVEVWARTVLRSLNFSRSTRSTPLVCKQDGDTSASETRANSADRVSSPYDQCCEREATPYDP